MTIIQTGVAQNIGKRPTLEDEHAIYSFPDQSFFTAEVYDGHGGREAATVASEMLTPAFLDLWNTEQKALAHKRRSNPELLREAYRAVDDYIAKKHPKTGTTAATFYITGDRFLVSNAGDTRVVVGTRKNALCLTVDHRPDLNQERGRIEAAGGRILNLGVPRVEGILAVTRSLGDSYLKPLVSAEPRIVEGTLGRENDFVVVACDGIWDVLTPEEVLRIVRSAHNPDRAAEKVVETALGRDGRDNMTIVVADLGNYTKECSQKKMVIERTIDMLLIHS